VAVLPLRSVPESLKEMKRAKELGAVGVFFRGIEGDKTLDHPYFHPIYEHAVKLDMAICIHTGSGAPWMLPYFEHARNHTFAHGRALPIFAFRDLIANRIPEKFPGLRTGFIEASAGWAPFMIHILRRLFKDRPKFKNSAELFRDYNLFIACEADEDIPYLAKCIGEDNIVIGSDYGHNDPSAEEKLVETLQKREDIPEPFAEKILVHNPRRLYGLQ
jgi:predicted TIM-barrel fold metal-dependent hydrolase